MARPVEFEKKRVLARRAVEVLEREGLDTSMAQLADALGVKRPTLLYHFPSRVELVELALLDLLSEQAEFVVAAIERETHPIDRLYAQLRAVHEFHHGREKRVVFLTQAVAAAAGPRLESLLALGNAVFEDRRRAMVDDLRAGIQAGAVAPCDPEVLYSTLRALIDGLLVQRVVTGLDLGPIHTLVWTQLLAPLRLGAPAQGRRV